MPCCLRLAWASASAMFTLPQPILPVGGSMVVVVAPDGLVEVSLTSVPSRNPVTSDLEFDSDPASGVYLSTSRSSGTVPEALLELVLVELACGQTANGAPSSVLATNSVQARFFSIWDLLAGDERGY